MSERIFFLKSGKCAWKRCLFCGYGRTCGIEPTVENLIKEFDLFFGNLNNNITHLKVFGSGSFLDEKQVPKEARLYFIEKCRKNSIKELTIESRPEFITSEKLREFNGITLTVAVGLEVADNHILDKINKGFCLRDYENAAGILHSHGCKLRTYLLVNPPFVDDIQKSLENSVEYALKYSDSVVLINLLPHFNSELFEMWLHGEWNFLSKEEFYKVTKKFKNNPKIELDIETFRFIPKFPKHMQENLKGVGEEFLTHPHFEVWQDYLVRWYKPPEDKEFLLFLPCSYEKPYSGSKTHRGIIEKLKKLNFYNSIHQVMISNAGVVPREFEDMYPFNAYDWNERLETPEIKDRYIEITAIRLEKYLRYHKYKKIFCFLKYDSESYKALEIACNRLNLEFRNLLNIETYEKIKTERNPLQTEEALNDIYIGLKDEISQI